MKNIFLLLATSASLLSQSQNLVPNPGFESSTCNYPTVALPATDWFKPNNSTPDYMNSCNTNASFKTPANFIGTQAPRTGNAYYNIAVYYTSTANFREYISVRLTTPLTVGNTYRASMWVSAGDDSDWSIDELGLYLSSTLVYPVCPTSFCVWAVTPQVSSPDGTYLTNQSGWVEIAGNFVAAGGEEYLTIGNFKNDASTSLFKYQATGQMFDQDYATYYIDDVSVTTQALPAGLTSFTAQEALPGTVQLDWETASETNNDYFAVEKSVDGREFSETGRVQGSGNSSSARKYTFTDPFTAACRLSPADYLIYRLRQVDYDGTATYSHTITLSPRKENGSFSIRLDGYKPELVLTAEGASRVNWTVYNYLGQCVYSRETISSPGEPATAVMGDHSPGMYFATASWDGNKASAAFTIH